MEGKDSIPDLDAAALRADIITQNNMGATTLIKATKWGH
jgi:hypothetical protein